MAAQSTIVHADLCASVPRLPSAVASRIANAAKDSPTAGQYGIDLQQLSAEEVRQLIKQYPSGHERLALDRNLILLDAGAMLAYAPYRSRILLTDDPFDHIEELSEALGMDADDLRIRLYDALLSADSVVALGESAFDAVAPLLAQEPKVTTFPALALKADLGSRAPILIINHEDERMLEGTIALLAGAFPEERFVPFESSTVFAQGWKAMLQLGIAYSNLPGTRLSNAWVGGVPVIQMVNPKALEALHRRRSGQTFGLVVEHGKTGLLAPSIEELIATVDEFLLDPLPARAVARGAKMRVNLAAEWETVLKSILQ